MNLFSISSCGIKTISDWDPRRWHNKRVLALGIGQVVLQSNGLKEKKEKLKYQYYKNSALHRHRRGRGLSLIWATFCRHFGLK